MGKIVHIIEHYPKGTIYYLIKPLEEFDNQLVLYVPEDIYDYRQIFLFPKDTIFVLHITGRLTEFFMRYEELTLRYKVFLFLHVSIAYMEFQKRFDAIKKIVQLHTRGVGVLVPCSAIKNQLLEIGIDSQVIQIGIPYFNVNEQYTHLRRYTNKIVTCCSENTANYLYIKGIHEFTNFVIKQNLISESLIVGSEIEGMIESKRFSHDELLYILNYSRLYIQFSRYEAYNITAIEAKRMKVPVILYNVEGVKDNLKFGYTYDTFAEMEEEAVNIIQGKNEKEIIESNFLDSMERENIFNFAKEFDNLRRI